MEGEIREIREILRLPESVINQIAAGEVVQRPANVVKELIENSLDAQATEIVVSARAGGLKLLQVQDNGKGIARKEMDIVCERHTTSKLRQFEDLQSIASFGFRGEALASISHVAHISVTSRTVDSLCAYVCEYADGKPKAAARSCAGNLGTTITVEDLFFNQPTRKTALKSATDELNKIADVVTRYAIHNPSVAFSLRRHGAGSDIRTLGTGSQSAAVAALFGASVAKDLVALEAKSVKFCFELRGWLSQPLFISPTTTSRNKSAFVLFINERSVECRPLKHTVDLLFSTQDVVCPLVYLDLKIDPRRVDVNCHPTKNEVQFLDQAAILDRIQQEIETKLLDFIQQSRCHVTLSAASPSAGRPMVNKSLVDFCTSTKKENMTSVVVSDELGGPPLTKTPSEPKKLYDHQLIRTDKSEQRLTAFLSQNNSDQCCTSSATSSTTTVSQSITRRVCVELNGNSGQQSGDSGSDQVAKDIAEEIINVYGEESAEPSWRHVKLDSVHSLRRVVCQTASTQLRELFKAHTFVGCVDGRRALIQHLTCLYLVDVEKLSEQLFYQVILFCFGNFGCFKLSEAPLLTELYEMAADSGGTVSTEEMKSSAAFVELLTPYVPMLQDYFSICISADGRLITLPSILSGYSPQLEGLPQLIADLSTVHWEEEQPALEGICRSLSRFFALHIHYCDDDMHSALGQPTSWRQVVETLLFPAFKAKLLPPASFLSDGTITQVADLKDLYKVFERC